MFLIKFIWRLIKLLLANGIDWTVKPRIARDTTYAGTNARFILDAGTYAYLLEGYEETVTLANSLNLDTVKNRGANSNERFRVSVVYNTAQQQFKVKETAYAADPAYNTYTNDEIIVIDNYPVELASESIVQPTIDESNIIHRNVANEFANIPLKTTLSDNDKFIFEDSEDGYKKKYTTKDNISPDLTPYIPKSLYDAGTFLYATSDNTPEAKTVAQTLAILGFPSQPFWECTVGTVGDYVNVGAAVAAGKKRIILISNVTETANIEASAVDYYIISVSKSFTWALGAYSFNTANRYGHQTYYTNITITLSRSSGACLSEGKHFFKNCKITDTSTSTGTFISGGSSGYPIFEDCYITLPNVRGFAVAAGGLWFIRCTIEGSGTSSGFTNLSATIFHDCILTGTWYTAGIAISSNGGDINNLTTTATVTTSGYYYIKKINATNLTIRLATAIFSRVESFLAKDLVIVDNGITKDLYLCNGEFSAGFTISAGKLKFTNVYFTGAMVIANTITSVYFENCTFASTLTINTLCELIACTTNGLTISAATNNVIGGTHTTIAVNGNNNNISGTKKCTSITLAAGVTGNNVMGNQVDNAVADNSLNELNNVNFNPVY